MLITHIAMVMNRINENKEIEKIDNETIQSFKLCNCYINKQKKFYIICKII